MKHGILGVLGLVSSMASLFAQAPQPPLGAERWRQDLQFFAAQFPGVQKDFSKLYPRAPFDAAISSLQENAGTLSDGEMALGLMRLVASAYVAHTNVQTPNAFGFFRRLPLTLYWYSDGLAVTAASAEYSQAICARVLSIGSMTPDQILAALTPYIAHENGVWLRERAPSLLVTLTVRQHLGLLGSDGRAVFTLAKPDGVQFTMPVAIADPRVAQVGFADALQVPTPLFRSRPGTYYWYQYLPDSQTLYVQYNPCEDDPKLPFSRFAMDVLAEADARPLKRLIVDLRQNGGGNSRVIDPLRQGLVSLPKLRGRIFVLVGPSTFSSGLMNALQLRQEAHARLVGEAMGEKPNSYGEVRILTLPNSQIKVQYTVKYFQLAPHADPAQVDPDVAAPITLADALAGRDPALEAAIAVSVK